MTVEWPLVWPAEWRNQSGPHAPDTSGFIAFEKGHPPSGVTVIKGEPAGIKSHGDSTAAGPTGADWVDTNGWRIRLARLQNPGQTIWVETEPAKANEVVPFERYLLGVADAAAHGGRWAITLDGEFARAAAARQADALRNWTRLRTAIAFFARHTDWNELTGRAALGVLSDFRGDNEFMSQEILNLAARQQLPYQLLDKGALTAVPAGMIAVVYADAQSPAPALRKGLEAFVAGGGLLITGKAWGNVAGSPLPESPTLRYAVYPAGRGRIALAKEMDDPYLVAADAQVLLSHRNDIIRLWNGGSIGAYPAGDARRTVVHLLNYSAQPGNEPPSLWVAGDFRKAVLDGFEFEKAKQLDVVPVRGGVEVHLPRIGVYAAVEVS